MSEAIERYQEIQEHINFQKAMLDDYEDGNRFNKYLQILEGVKNGDFRTDNPVDREIARILSMALNDEVDPWNIDLVEFSNAYIQEIKRSDSVDFMVAGKIIFLAWSVLKKQSDATLSKAEGMEDMEFFFEGWSPWEFDAYENIDDISFTDAVVNSEEAPINTAVRYRAERKVTLIELVDAFEEARKEVEFREKVEKIRKNARKMKIEMPDISHKEDIEEEIKEVWNRIKGLKERETSLMALTDGSREDVIKVFVALLFLANRNRIRIWQETPESDIKIENIMPRDEDGNTLEPPIIVEEEQKRKEITVCTV